MAMPRPRSAPDRNFMTIGHPGVRSDTVTAARDWLMANVTVKQTPAVKTALGGDLVGGGARPRRSLGAALGHYRLGYGVPRLGSMCVSEI